MQCPSACAKQPRGVTKACPPYPVMAAEAGISFCLTTRVSAQASGGLGFLWLPSEYKDETTGGSGHFAHGAAGTLAPLGIAGMDVQHPLHAQSQQRYGCGAAETRVSL